MANQLELLRQSLAGLEAKGLDGPMVQGLRAQIAMHERAEWRAANGGWWGPAAGWLQQPCGEGQPLEVKP